MQRSASGSISCLQASAFVGTKVSVCKDASALLRAVNAVRNLTLIQSCGFLEMNKLYENLNLQFNYEGLVCPAASQTYNYYSLDFRFPRLRLCYTLSIVSLLISICLRIAFCSSFSIPSFISLHFWTDGVRILAPRIHQG